MMGVPEDLAGPGYNARLPDLGPAGNARRREAIAALATRLGAFGPAFDGLVDTLEADRGAGVVPADFVIERTRRIIANFVAPAPRAHSLVTTLADKLGAAGVAADDLVAEAERLLADVVYPAYVRVDAALAALEPVATSDAGIWRLPDGERVHERPIRLRADSGLGADAVHELGLAEVERIQAELEPLLRDAGLADGTAGKRLARLSTDPAYVVPDDDKGRAALIASANAYIAELEPLLDDWFGTLPPQPVEVRRIPEAVEDAQALGRYTQPPLDGSAPGRAARGAGPRVVCL